MIAQMTWKHTKLLVKFLKYQLATIFGIYNVYKASFREIYTYTTFKNQLNINIKKSQLAFKSFMFYEYRNKIRVKQCKCTFLKKKLYRLSTVVTYIYIYIYIYVYTYT